MGNRLSKMGSDLQIQGQTGLQDPPSAVCVCVYVLHKPLADSF